jgi:hypothetical protein
MSVNQTEGRVYVRFRVLTAASNSETSVNLNMITRRYIPEDTKLYEDRVCLNDFYGEYEFYNGEFT